MTRNITLVSLLLATSVCAAQLQFTEYVGEIKVGYAPTTVAADSHGRLYYGTFNHPNNLFCNIRVIEDPLASIGATDETGTTVVLMRGTGKINAHGRGVQSMTFMSDDTLLVSGDNSVGSWHNLWKFDYTEGSPPVFTEDEQFAANVRAERPRRRSGVSIVSEDGDGLLITVGFAGEDSYVDYFNLAGNVIGTPLTDTAFYRDVHFIPGRNIAYPFRNGYESDAIISAYISGINTTTGGGSVVPAPLIPDGGPGGTTGHPIQGGYYYQDQDQLIVVDGWTSSGPTPTVRVFNINTDGSELTLAYSIPGLDSETPFPRIFDAVVIDDHLYICGYDLNAADMYATSKIYAFKAPDTTGVDDWNIY